MGKNIVARIVTLLILLMMLTSSCTLSTGEHPTEPLELPSRFSHSGNTALSSEWWLDLEDPIVTTLIEQALSDNFSLLIARDRLQEARASAVKAGAILSPTLGGRARATSRRDYQTEDTSNTLLLELAASYEIDLWGRLAAIRDVAVLETQASEADLQTAAMSIAAEVAQTWYRIVETRLQLQLLQEQKKTNSRVLELITIQFRAGQAGAPDVLQQRQLVETNSAELADIRRNLRLLEHLLSILLGEIPGTSKFQEISTLVGLAPLPNTGLMVDLLTRRPDIESSYLQLLAADRRVAAAIADRLPRLSISAELATSGDHAANLFSNWFTSFIANLAGPILDGGQRKAEVERQRAIMSQLLNKYGQTILRAIGEVEDALTHEQAELEIMASLNIRLRLAAQTVDHVAVRYRRGVENYQRVLTALISHQKLQQKVIKSKRLLIEYRIGLYRALGGNIPLSGKDKRRTSNIE